MPYSVMYQRTEKQSLTQKGGIASSLARRWQHY